VTARKNPTDGDDLESHRFVHLDAKVCNGVGECLQVADNSAPSEISKNFGNRSRAPTYLQSQKLLKEGSYRLDCRTQATTRT